MLTGSCSAKVLVALLSLQSDSFLIGAGGKAQLCNIASVHSTGKEEGPQLH